MELGGYRLYKGRQGKWVIKSVVQFGVGFLVHSSIVICIEEFLLGSPRVARLTIKTLNKINECVHAPTNIKNVKEREETKEFWEKLDLEIKEIPKQHVKILVGGFNTQLGQERKFCGVVGKWPAYKSTNKNGRRLIELYLDNYLILKTTIFKKQPHKLKTCWSSNPDLGNFKLTMW